MCGSLCAKVNGQLAHFMWGYVCCQACHVWHICHWLAGNSTKHFTESISKLSVNKVRMQIKRKCKLNAYMGACYLHMLASIRCCCCCICIMSIGITPTGVSRLPPLYTCKLGCFPEKSPYIRNISHTVTNTSQFTHLVRTYHHGRPTSLPWLSCLLVFNDLWLQLRLVLEGFDFAL